MSVRQEDMIQSCARAYRVYIRTPKLGLQKALELIVLRPRVAFEVRSGQVGGWDQGHTVIWRWYNDPSKILRSSDASIEPLRAW